MHLKLLSTSGGFSMVWVLNPPLNHDKTAPVKEQTGLFCDLSSGVGIEGLQLGSSK
jgi:hypothetical protein